MQDKFPCGPWRGPWWSRLSPCSPWVPRGADPHAAAPPWRSPRWNRWICPRGGCDLWRRPQRSRVFKERLELVLRNMVYWVTLVVQ